MIKAGSTRIINSYHYFIVSIVMAFGLGGCAGSAQKSYSDGDPARGGYLKNIYIGNERSLYPNMPDMVPVKISPTKDENSETGIVVPWDKMSAISEFKKIMPRSYVRSLRIVTISGGLMCASNNDGKDSYVIAWIQDNWINHDRARNLARSYGVESAGALYRDILAGKIMFSICESKKP